MASSGKVTAWLAAQGWTFTEMTEAQKLEMRSTLNICGYATSGSKRQRPCARPPSPNGRCKTPGHGGAALKGIAHPGYKHGDYSPVQPDQMDTLPRTGRERPAAARPSKRHRTGRVRTQRGAGAHGSRNCRRSAHGTDHSRQPFAHCSRLSDRERSGRPAAGC